MRMTRAQFLNWEHKALTLLGMSGVGKTTLANHLPKQRWFHYSADYRIGTRYLGEPIIDNVKKMAMDVPFLRALLRSDSIQICNNITVDNLEPVSTFLGKLGAPQAGGLSVEEFKSRQRAHYEAEVAAMCDVAAFIRKAHEIYGYAHFVNDAGGSVCELDDEAAIGTLVEHTVIIYVRADAEMTEELIRRAIHRPKPLYYREEFLDRELAAYLAEHRLESVEEMDPDAFVQWIFPRLVAHRLPRYEALVERCGYAVQARDAQSVRDEADFLALIGDAIGRGQGVG